MKELMEKAEILKMKFMNLLNNILHNNTYL